MDHGRMETRANGIKGKRTYIHIIQTYEEGNFLLQIEKAKALKCGTFGASSLQQRYLATGDFDGRMQIWYIIKQPFFSFE